MGNQNYIFTNTSTFLILQDIILKFSFRSLKLPSFDQGTSNSVPSFFDTRARVLYLSAVLGVIPLLEVLHNSWSVP